MLSVEHRENSLCGTSIGAFGLPKMGLPIRTFGMNRLLSMDGGGIRGVFTIGILEKIEEMLRERHAAEKPDLVLADYFNFMGGTSTGAIIAAMLSRGDSVRSIREAYEELGPMVFRRKPIWKAWRSFFGSEKFADFLKERFQEPGGDAMTMGSRQLRSYLMVVMRNGSTGSTWLVNNNPKGKFNQPAAPGATTNLDIPLWQLVRASTAAPVYFPSEIVTVQSQDGEEKTFEFIDGGVSPYNNPALGMYLMATMPEYEMGMPRGVDQLFLCSVGTGRLPVQYPPGELGRINAVGGALRTLRGLMDALGVEQDLICRALSKCQHGDSVNLQVGDMKGNPDGAFLYSRYQHTFTEDDKQLCIDTTGSKNPFELDDVQSTPVLLELGRQYAEEHVKAEDFPVMDLKKPLDRPWTESSSEPREVKN